MGECLEEPGALGGAGGQLGQAEGRPGGGDGAHAGLLDGQAPPGQRLSGPGHQLAVQRRPVRQGLPRLLAQQVVDQERHQGEHPLAHVVDRRQRGDGVVDAVDDRRQHLVDEAVGRGDALAGQVERDRADGGVPDALEDRDERVEAGAEHLLRPPEGEQHAGPAGLDRRTEHASQGDQRDEHDLGMRLRVADRRFPHPQERVEDQAQ
jgi:hypothetical protein